MADMGGQQTAYARSSKLPDIAKQLRLPYPIDQASSAPNVFKTFFRALSPYDYTLYCRKWVKPNLTCTPQDDSQYPGWIQRQQVITCHRQIGQQLNYHQDILVQNPIYSQTLINPMGQQQQG